MDGKLISFLVVGGVAIAVALYNYFTEMNKPMVQQQEFVRVSPSMRKSRSPSPESYPRRRRRSRSRSPPLKRSSSSGYTSPTSSESSHDAQLSSNCLKCGKNSFVEINPCKHSSMCKDCFDHHLKSSNKCPVCSEVIVSCRPQSNTWGKCKKCDQFSKLILVKPCNHSVICTNCFNQHLESNGLCPHCGKPIEKCDPVSDTWGKCNVCDEFRLLAKFMPCGHANLCQPHSKMYNDMNGKKCFDCGKTVTEIL